MSESERHRVQHSQSCTSASRQGKPKKAKANLLSLFNVSDTKIHFSFSNNCSISLAPHFVFLSKVMCFSSTVHNWTSTSASCLQWDWWSHIMHGEWTLKICLVSAMTGLISWLSLACLLQKQAENNQTKNLAN